MAKSKASKKVETEFNEKHVQALIACAAALTDLDEDSRKRVLAALDAVSVKHPSERNELQEAAISVLLNAVPGVVKALTASAFPQPPPVVAGPFDPAATPVPVNSPSSDPIRSDLIGWFTSLSPDQQGAIGSEKLNELLMMLGMPPAL